MSSELCLAVGGLASAAPLVPVLARLLELPDIAELDTDPFNVFSLPFPPPPLPTRVLNESLSVLTLSSSFNI
jgi:hypothetical protein